MLCNTLSVIIHGGLVFGQYILTYLRNHDDFILAMTV